MDISVRRPRSSSTLVASAFHDIFRIGANDWGIAVGTFLHANVDHDGREERIRAGIRASAGRHHLPSSILEDFSEGLRADGSEGELGPVSSIMVGRLELDVCGAWIILASAGEVRPFTTRQAGWIDVRGHAASSPASAPLLSPSDDRVGLGPGDALVVVSEELLGVRAPSGDRYKDEVLPDLLLGSIGTPAADVAAGAMSEAIAFGGEQPTGDGVVMVIRVPAIERGRALARVADATGIPADELQLPAHPMGDAQTDLWKASTTEPREARIKLAPEPRSVPALRRLLRRLLQSWRLPADEDLELLASEVATNVFAGATAHVTAIVRYDGEVVRVEIGDGASPHARRTVPGYDELSGPRLLLVDTLSTDWGVVRTRAGRRVWFEVPVEAHAEP